jgi:HEAT repeat protein
MGIAPEWMTIRTGDESIKHQSLKFRRCPQLGESTRMRSIGLLRQIPTSRKRICKTLLRVWLACFLLIDSGCSRHRPYEGKSVTQLTQMLQSDDSNKQIQGAFGLSQLGSQAKDAAPALVTALKSRHTSVREHAALALGTISPEAQVAVPALTEALRDSEMTVRRQAAIALGRLGPEARLGLSALEKASRDPDRLVREAVRQAVSQIKK